MCENNKQELTHHGVKGMKWGVRRTPQQLGAARTAKQVSQLKTAVSVAGSASKGFNSAANIAGNMGGRRPSKKQKKTLNQMTDQELRQKINRMQMEQQYASMNPSRRARGAAAAKSMLEVAGNVAAVGGSALAIALAIKQLKG